MEFDLIAFIKSKSQMDSSVALGIGDDAAIINGTESQQLVITTDTLVAGIHFDGLATPEQIGYKALAVNLSDIAAMGAIPKWITLNVTLPTINMDWIEPFVAGFIQLSKQYQLNLVGGDTTQGPTLSITVTVFGKVEKGQYLTRAGAKRGDLIAVTGEIGSAAFALKHRNKGLDSFLYTPNPQIEISQHIKNFAHACIDISDGLLADLGHICKQSQLGAKIALEQIPVNHLLKETAPDWSNHVLTGGDDYQLCFTFAAEDINKLPVNCSIIGQMGCGDSVKVFANNQEVKLKDKGFIHFNDVK